MGNKINVVVYGTLKKGFALHGNMKAIGAKFLKEAKLNGFKMYDYSGWFPAVVKSDSEEDFVNVEVYETNDEGLKRLDSVEGYPSLYQRTKTEEGWMYTMDPDKVKGKNLIETGNWK